MTRNEAMEKINKCIALATNVGATEGEKRNAWAMAEKLASKYGFKIMKREAPKATDINFYNRTAKEESRPVEYVVYKVSRYDARFVSRILYKLGYSCFTLDNEFTVRNDKAFDFDAFKELYKCIMKQYDADLYYFKNTTSGWGRIDSMQFKREWISGFVHGLAEEEFSDYRRFCNAGYEAGKKLSYYAKKIRKEVA